MRSTAGQLCVLLRAAAAEICWALPAVSSEVAQWRWLALQIPDAEIRGDALSALADKRGHTDGAALFSILAACRDRGLLRLLAAYELIWDFLDTADEHGQRFGGVRNGRQLHLALIDALEPSCQATDYYRYHPWQDDGGYLRTLVATCRLGAGRLVSYAPVRRPLLREAWHAQVLALNHDTDRRRREAALRAWAESELARESPLWWFERTAAASASLTIHALLALASAKDCDPLEVERVRSAYAGWISVATTMLDSFADQVEDRLSGNHSYISYYQCGDQATRRVRRQLNAGIADAGALPDAQRHVLIVSCMAAMYLSKPSPRGRRRHADWLALARAGGWLTIGLLAPMRLWRLYAKSAT
jgi:tetraprenyl-beta-curcumene synthase